MDDFQSEFDAMFQMISGNSEIAPPESESIQPGFCRTCNEPAAYEGSTDMYVCERCGKCEKALKPFFSYSEMQNRSYEPNQHRHKYIRLRKTMDKMQINDVQIRGLIRSKFSEVITYFQFNCPTSRKNIMRYDYVIAKILEIQEIHVDSPYEVKLSKSTLKQYDKIWMCLCEKYGYPFISTTT